MTDRRVLGFVWTLLAMAVAYVLGAGVLWTFTTLDVANPRVVGNIPLSTIVGVALAAAIAGGLWAAPKPRTFGIEVVEETRKVVWPSWPEVRDGTLVVTVTAVVFAVILGLFDLLWARVTNFVLSGSL